ncbi:hypothetical protein DFO67_10296 [Modicisalibacter xianhensis]|uniref:Uncharacterized protein n=1 Tax=Modicisalibacter xianhensis TaxID=442341 RepID=A0A4R8FYL7_9GAMM|nr:hypothetical protein DFO67_10296 [Halomonas xianhensis]
MHYTPTRGVACFADQKHAHNMRGSPLSPKVCSGVLRSMVCVSSRRPILALLYRLCWERINLQKHGQHISSQHDAEPEPDAPVRRKS